MEDKLYLKAIEVILREEGASAALLQLKLKIGYARAWRLIEVMESEGLVGPLDGAKPRTINVRALQRRLSGLPPKASFIERNKPLLIWVLVALGAYFVVFLWPHETSWSGEGSISVFPAGASAKNYRLPAELKVTEYRKGWQHDRYESTIESADWPNGGNLYLDGCNIVENTRQKCMSSEGEEYEVEITEYPPAPVDDSSDYDYGY